MTRAVFLDRDGVINKLIFNPSSGEHESPLTANDMQIYPYVLKSLKLLQDNGYILCLVSNQPNYAKGKATMKMLNDIHDKMHSLFISNEIFFQEYCYCFHHPEHTGKCACRKPSPYFLLRAARKHEIDMKNSWMVGDQDTDIYCGISGGVQTILIDNKDSINKRGKSNPDYIANNLREAVNIIMKEGT